MNHIITLKRKLVMGYTSKIRGKHKVFDFGQVGAALFFVNPRTRDLTRDLGLNPKISG